LAQIDANHIFRYMVSICSAAPTPDALLFTQAQWLLNKRLIVAENIGGSQPGTCGVDLAVDF
jgi:hypothetical protein